MKGSKKKWKGPFLWALFAVCILGHAPFSGPAGVFAAPYGLPVIAPEEFAAPVNALVAYKNATGIPAVLVTLESIYGTFTGVDQPEKIKQAIRYHREIRPSNTPCWWAMWTATAGSTWGTASGC